MDRFALILTSGVLIVCFAGVLPVSGRLVNQNPSTAGESASDAVHTSAFIQTLGDSPDTLSFATFARRHGKRYENEEHMRKRFKVFVENLRTVEMHNKKGLSYTMGINEFSDMTWEEFRNSKLQTAPQKYSTAKKTKSNDLKLADDDDDSKSDIPESKDWRESGIIGPVKNQGQCGSCWAFSVTGALEAAYVQAHGGKDNISLSEQQIMDCANGNGCSGGSPSDAFEYVKENGLQTEDSYPYYGMNYYCHPSNENGTDLRLSDYISITSGDEDELKRVIGLIRPVSVIFEAINDFRYYTGGVFSSPMCSSQYLNHAVLAVGYGEENDTPYWLVKNSWGESWGDKGYFKIERGGNMCGIASGGCYPVLSESA